MPTNANEWAFYIAATVCGLLLAAVIYFLKRLIDQQDDTRKTCHSINTKLQKWTSSFDLKLLALKSDTRLGFERAKVKYDDMESLCLENMKPETATE